MKKFSMSRPFAPLRFFALAFLLDPVAACRAIAADAELASPAIDASMFRDGEVKRGIAEFGAWSTVCDEVARLRQRFCSLKARIHDPGGRMIAEMIVSTGDNGCPAAMLHIGAGVHIGSGAKLWLEPVQLKGAKKAVAKPARQLYFISCEVRFCTAVWSLAGEDIAALNAGASVRLRVVQVKPFGPLTASIASPERLIALDGAAEGGGFAQAIASTLK